MAKKKAKVAELENINTPSPEIAKLAEKIREIISYINEEK